MQTITIPARVIPEHTVELYEYSELPEEVKAGIRESYIEANADFHDECDWSEIAATFETFGIHSWTFDVGGGAHIRSFEPFPYDKEHKLGTWCDFDFQDVLDEHSHALKTAWEIAERLQDTGSWFDAQDKYNEFLERILTLAMERLYDIWEAECEYHRSAEFADEMLSDGTLYTADGDIW